MRILFRTDAATELGSGHIMRCASLAHVLCDAGHEVRFVCRGQPGDLIAWLQAEGFAVERIDGRKHVRDEWQDAEATTLAVRGQRFDWVVVDHYDLGPVWERAIGRVAERVCAFDDVGRAHHCHILLDQNYANPTHELYCDRVPDECTLLLGPRFAPLRPEFARLRPAALRRRRDGLAAVLVCMGGSDPFNETAKVLAGLGRMTDRNFRIDVAIGSNNPNGGAIAAACAALPGTILHVQTSRLGELLAEADCAICGGGGIDLERCVLGVPALVTIMADNQAAVAAMGDAGGCRLLGRRSEITADQYAQALRTLDAATLTRMSRAAAEICDGAGAARVAARMTATFNDQRLARSGLNA
jgi:UDP-2,4-diacetamido-2,4,6-trideoxy-beta-L-altropyranose hydrolase